MSNTSSNGKAKTLVKPKPKASNNLTLEEIRRNSMDTLSISSTNSLQNDFDEIRSLIRDSATLYCEAAKLQVENMRQISEVLGLIRSLTALNLQQALDRQKSDNLLLVDRQKADNLLSVGSPRSFERQKTEMETKDSKVFSTLPKTPNRPESRRGMNFSQTQILTPVRSRSVSRLQGMKSYDV